MLTRISIAIIANVHIMDKWVLAIYLPIVGKTVKYTVINALFDPFQCVEVPCCSDFGRL